MKCEKACQKRPKGATALALNVAIDTIGEKTSWGGGAAQVHNGKHLSRGAGKGDVVST